MLPALAAALLLAAAGCAQSGLPHPGGALQSYAAALQRDDPHAAWLELSDAQRGRTSESVFSAAWRDSASERASQLDAVKVAIAKQRWRETAKVRAAGQVASLVRQADGWRLSSARRTQLGAATPEEALRRFVEGLEDRNFDTVIQILADPLKAVVEREINERLTRAREASGKPVTVEGNHARIRFDSRYHLDLVKENGQWRIADFN